MSCGRFLKPFWIGAWHENCPSNTSFKFER
jgi:hypothetical protein